MKKLMTVLLAGAFVFSSFQYIGPTAEVAAADLGPVIGKPKLAVLVDGRKVKFSGGEPFMENNRVQVPLRGIGETLGAKVGYSGKTVTYIKGEKSISLTLGSKVAEVDGKKVTMDTPAKAINGRTYVPLRFVSENLGESVSWDQVGSWVWIGEKEKAIPSTDDEVFALKPLSEFKEYTQSAAFFKNSKGESYANIKTIKSSDLPIRLGDSQVIYSIDLVKHKGEEFIQIRSSDRNTPISFLVKNSFARGRHGLDNAFINNGDQTGMSIYPITSSLDLFQNGEFVENYDYTKFQLKQADYILLRDGDVNYAVAIENPFK